MTRDTNEIELIKEELVKRTSPTLTIYDIDANAELVHDILALKKKHNVLMLGHNYMEPLVFGLSDENEKGDSLGLSMSASKTDSEYIIFNGVPFMAETAKILNMSKRVFVADKSAGCSLADEFTPEDVLRLKELNPGVPVMTYINTYADVKAECDVCCTSANAQDIAMRMPGDSIIFVPDIYFAQNLKEELGDKKKIIYPNGNGDGVKGAICEVHEMFTLEDITLVRDSFGIEKENPDGMIYVHWECKPEVLREADFFGSTTQIRKDIAQRVSEGSLKKAFIASECELTSNLMQEFPTVEFWTACYVRCQHMAKVTLKGIHDLLVAIDSGSDLSEYEILIDEEVARRANRSINKMMELSV